MAREVSVARDLLAGEPARAHLIGAGGVGMAGIAVLLNSRGWQVAGCDAMESSVAAWLRARGIPVAMGHDAAHITSELSWIIRSAAVRAGAEEVRAGMERGIPVSVRGAVLPALIEDRTSIAVSGTHGKTTTTSMITQMLKTAGRDVSFAIGAEVPALGGVAGAGADPVVVVEADESDGTVAQYHADYAVITNAELDHVDYFSNAAEFEACLGVFAGQARRAAIVGCDDAGARRLARGLPRAVTFGFSEDADVRMSGGEVFWRGKRLGPLRLSVAGRHNSLNALAACAVGLEMGLEFPAMAGALAVFQPAKRRFELVAHARGVRVISDYAHHPTEIRAMMSQARELGAGRLIAIFQPHRHSRTAAMGVEFALAFEGVDALTLAPVYSASEDPVPGGTSQDLARHFSAGTHCAPDLRSAWGSVRGELRSGDVLLVVGAGDVEKIAYWAKEELNSGSVGG